jgi:hypothetical protein
MKSARIFYSCVGLMAVAVLSPGLADAQRPQEVEISSRVPVTIALAETINSNGGAGVIYRRANLVPHDVIVLNASAAGPRVLEEAIFTLLMSRALGGDTASTSVTLKVPFPTESSPTAESRFHGSERGRATAVVNRLRQASQTQISGLGELRAITVYLPPKVFAGKLHEQQVR